VKPVAVYIQDRLQGDWTHDSRVAVTMGRIGLDVHIVTLHCVVPWISLPIFQEPSRFAAIKRIASLRPDVLFCEGGAWHLLALPFARHTWVRTPARSPSQSKDLLQRALLRQAEAVSICNPWERERWRSYRLVDLAYPLDNGFWSLPTERDPGFWERHGMPLPRGSVIACVGQIIRRKRPVELFDALAILLQERDDLILVFAGETFEAEVESALRARISVEGLTDRVHLPGLVQPREELRQLLAWADIHVLNTLWESQCMALYESLAAGVPTLIPAIPELTSAFPNLPAHRNGHELRRNVTALLDDPQLGERLVGSSKPHLEWAYNESHDRTVHRLCAEWLNGAVVETAP